MTNPEPALLDVASVAALERWLAKHHADTPQGVWLRLYRKGGAPPTVTLTYPDAVLVGLCWGWIDGQVRKHDDVSRVVRFTPRRPRSIWSKLNTERVERLIAEGRMQPPGLAQVEAAKADGRWAAAYGSLADEEVPADFLAELATRPDAMRFYETLTKSARYPILIQLQTAKKPETRARRLAKLLDTLEAGERP